MQTKTYFYVVLALVSSLLLLISAPSFASKDSPGVGTYNHSQRGNIRSVSNEISVRHSALSQFSNWKGTKYQWGGTTHHGIDCSALMQKIVPHVYGVNLPRTTTEQIKLGKKVKRQALTPGDLVFFRTSPGQKHVGLYIGNGEFINSSSSKGVIISKLNNSYWNAHYLTARRIHSNTGSINKNTLLADQPRNYKQKSAS